MNKFLRYSLSLVLAFVASVTFAGTTPYKVLTFPDEGTEGKTIGAYDKTWKATIGEDVWTIENFNSNTWNNWKYIKCGSNKFESNHYLILFGNQRQTYSNCLLQVWLA